MLEESTAVTMPVKLGRTTRIAVILNVPSVWRSWPKTIWSPTLSALSWTVWPALVTVAPVASIVRVQPSSVWSESLLPSIFVIVIAPNGPWPRMPIPPGPNWPWFRAPA